MTKSVNQEPILVPIPKKYLTKNYYFEPNNNNLIYCAKNKKIDCFWLIDSFNQSIRKNIKCNFTVVLNLLTNFKHIIIKQNQPNVCWGVK